jgi:septal ring factor EnvC (AmiA/AmiB activator)
MWSRSFFIFLSLLCFLAVGISSAHADGETSSEIWNKLLKENALQKQLLNEQQQDLKTLTLDWMRLSELLKQAKASLKESRQEIVNSQQALTVVEDSLNEARQSVDRERWRWGISGAGVGIAIAGAYDLAAGRPVEGGIKIGAGVVITVLSQVLFR